MKLIVFLILSFVSISAQDFLIEANHPVIDFILRMKAKGHLTSAESFAYPVHRYEVKRQLQSILNIESLTQLDRESAEYYLIKFDNDRASKQSALTEKFEWLPQKQSFFYHSDTTDLTVGINLNFDLNSFSGSEGKPARTIIAGGLLSGSFKEFLTFNLHGMNGIFSGDKNVVKNERRYSTNYKLQDTPESGFFDETEGNFSLYHPNINFTLARNDITLGYGKLKPLLNTIYPHPDFMSLNLDFDIVDYNFLHGTLTGPVSYLPDSITGGIREIPEKFIVYHTVGFNLSNSTKLNFGEMVTYSARGMDLGYLNPFNFYKTVEHSRIDRDNTAIFAGFESYLPEGNHIYIMLLFDDIDYGKLGTGWWGNQVLLHLGATHYTTVGNFPVDIHAEFMEIQPYVFSHRVERNSFTNLNTPIWGNFEPNSVVYSLSADIRWKYNLLTEITGTYIRHGDNEYDQSGNLLVNHGGRATEGHRTNDAEYVKLLSGIRENIVDISAAVRYEPSQNLELNGLFRYRSSDRASKITVYKLFTVSLLYKI